MAGPARRLAALAQAPAVVARRVVRTDTDMDMDRAPERDTARLPAVRVDTPARTLDVADKAHRAHMAGRVDRVTVAWRWRYLEPLRYTADTGHTVSGQREAVRTPE